MSVYVIIDVKVNERESYLDYVKRVRSIVENYGGRYLARGGKIVSFAGHWDPERIILIEFPFFRDVKRWLESEEYKKIAPLREGSTGTRAIIVEGCEHKE